MVEAKMKSRVLVCAYACLGNPGHRVPGGGNIMAWNFVKRLSRSYVLWVLTSAQNRVDIETALKREPLPNVQFHYIDLPGWLRPLQRFQGGIQFYAYLWQVRAYFAARRLHRRIQFDAFHHLTYDNDWMASHMGALLPVPYIRGPGGGAHRIPKAFLQEFCFRGRLWERLRALGQWLFRHDPFFILGQRRARAILLCNREALEAIPRKWQHKAQLFPLNGVSSNDLSVPVSAAQPHEKFRVLSAGRLVRIKAFDLAIRAFKLFVDRCPVIGPAGEAEFTIVGDGPELSRLESLVRKLGIETQVRFEQWKPREELLAKMASCDVFLFPSLRDGGGLVVVEAMAAGKPVVCLDIAGPGMHVTNDCGIKITPHSPQQAVRELAIALERLYTDKELRLRLGRAARERAEQVYHWDRLGERLLEIYEHTLRSPLTEGNVGQGLAPGRRQAPALPGGNEVKHRDNQILRCPFAEPVLRPAQGRRAQNDKKGRAWARRS